VPSTAPSASKTPLVRVASWPEQYDNIEVHSAIVREEYHGTDEGGIIWLTEDYPADFPNTLYQNHLVSNDFAGYFLDNQGRRIPIIEFLGYDTAVSGYKGQTIKFRYRVETKKSI